jgi:hypothetical protein
MKHILMNDSEPSDLDLINLMKEVAKESKEKADIEKQHLNDTIAKQILVIQTYMKTSKE